MDDDENHPTPDTRNRSQTLCPLRLGIGVTEEALDGTVLSLHREDTEQYHLQQCALVPHGEWMPLQPV